MHPDHRADPVSQASSSANSSKQAAILQKSWPTGGERAIAAPYSPPLKSRGRTAIRLGAGCLEALASNARGSLLHTGGDMADAIEDAVPKAHRSAEQNQRGFARLRRSTKTSFVPRCSPKSAPHARKLP